MNVRTKDGEKPTGQRHYATILLIVRRVPGVVSTFSQRRSQPDNRGRARKTTEPRPRHREQAAALASVANIDKIKQIEATDEKKGRYSLIPGR
ncbi:hypothetical protein GWI33_017581 [Rhynchophorus ferrugineus]|uniref:Uncharacterized protein n=1 Tax=Rhynchophorus ferrugineus TaxID=354439 RepID=A0A834M3L2_RHYFE|nr:hypothetical protein GWI33_017581 [Rhynchophorus ferrugineus]